MHIAEKNNFSQFYFLKLITSVYLHFFEIIISFPNAKRDKRTDIELRLAAFQCSIIDIFIDIMLLTTLRHNTHMGNVKNIV
jgi:hypothetical protein